MKLWQHDMLEKIILFFQPKKDVLGLVLLGSCSGSDGAYDYWSDIDILLVVDEDKLEDYYPSTKWLKHFGNMYTFDQSNDQFKYVTRVCFDDFRRLDIIITTEPALTEIEKWQRNPIHSGSIILFSRSKILDTVAGNQYELPKLQSFSREDFQKMINKFRFKSMLTVNKVARNDLLIALHLALDLMRDCCLLGMMLRDRAEGTDFHKEGDVGNPIVDRLQKTQKQFTAIGILDIVDQSNIMFDKLAGEWSTDYLQGYKPIKTWIEKARKNLKPEDNNMSRAIRNAQIIDIPQLVELSEQKRLQYQQYQPTFWRKAKNSGEVQLSYFEDLIKKENNIVLVYQMERQIIGFVIATLHSSPPVYNPGGLTCTIDDFCVAKPEDWSMVGNLLLAAVTTRAKEKGAVQIVVVCGHLDQPKRKMLSEDNFTIASEWYVRNI